MDMISTLKNSYFKDLLPTGWDMKRIKACVSNDPQSIFEPQPFWNKDFYPVPCDSLEEFGAYMGHEIATKNQRNEGNRQKAHPDPSRWSHGDV